jgi:dCTP deaminase
MILSNVSIHEALDKKWLVIDPEPQPRHKTCEAPDCPYQTSSVDLRLGSEIAYFKEGLAFSIDLRRGTFANLFGPNSENRTITEQQPYALAPHKMVLGRTLERIELPLLPGGNSLAARVEGKSSYARCGLLVHFTAPTIHAGFKGTITLELINLGIIPILLSPGAPICQLIIEQVHGIPVRNDSQFQGQGTIDGKPR